MNEKDKVRLQVHVDQELAERIDRMAQGMNRSTSWMVAELLIQGLLSQTRFIDWMAWRVIKLLGCADPRKLVEMFAGAPRPVHKGTIYLQTQISGEMVERLEKLAQANQRTRADMATLLLNWVADDQAWLLEMITQRWLREMYVGLGLPHGQQDAANGEENRSRKAGDGLPAALDTAAEREKMVA